MRTPHRLTGLRSATLTALGLVAYAALVYLVVVVGAGRLLPSGAAQLALTFLAAGLVAATLDPLQRAIRRVLPPSTEERLLRLTTERAESGDVGPAMRRLTQLIAESFGEGASARVDAQLGDQLTAGWEWPSDGRATSVTDGRTVRRRLAGDDRQLGEIVVRLPPGRTVTPIEDRLLDDAADHARLVLEAARMDHTLRDLVSAAGARHQQLEDSRRRILTVMEDEGRRVERDIHDGAQQHLVALAVNLRLLRVLLGRDHDRARRTATNIGIAVEEAVSTLEQLSAGLYPTALVESGPGPAIQLAAARSPVPVVLVQPERLPRWSGAVESAAYFSCLEAVQNAVKHAQARRIVVSLSAPDGDLAFEVTDDGRGFDPRTVSAGSGAANLHDRMSAVGGVVTVRSTIGEGTTVTGRIPAAEPGRGTR